MNTSLLKYCFNIFFVILMSAQLQSQNNAKNDLKKVRQFIPENLDSALYYSKNLMNYPNPKSDSLIAISHYFQGIIYYYKGHYYISSEHYKKALLSDFANQNRRFNGKIHNNLGVNYDMTDQFELALDEYKKSMEVDQEFDDLNGVAQSKINIGLLYFNLKQYDEGLTYIEEALEYFQQTKYHQGLGLCYHNMGMLYLEKKDYDKALDYLLNANSEYLASGDSYERGVNLNNLVKCANEMGYTEDAYQFLEECKQIALENNYEYLLELNLLSEAELYIENGQIEKANAIINSIDPTNIKATLRKNRIELQIDLANNTFKNYDEILHHYNEIVDSLHNYQTHQLINDLNKQYQTEIDDLNHQLEASINANNKQFYLLIGIITLLIVMFVAFYFKSKK